MLSFMGLVNNASDVCSVALMYGDVSSLYCRSTVVIANTISLFAGEFALRRGHIFCMYSGIAVTRLQVVSSPGSTFTENRLVFALGRFWII